MFYLLDVKMPAILFLCTANQFRSPIAAACFSQKLAASGVTETWRVDSAGTWAVEGLPAHPSAVEAAVKQGLNISSHNTKEVKAELLKDFDLLVVMETHHKEVLELEFPQVIGRIIILGQLASLPDADIPDPAREAFAEADAVANLVCSSIQRTYPKLVKFAQLLHEGYSMVPFD